MHIKSLTAVLLASSMLTACGGGGGPGDVAKVVSNVSKLSGLLGDPDSIIGGLSGLSEIQGRYTSTGAVLSAMINPNSADISEARKLQSYIGKFKTLHARVDKWLEEDPSRYATHKDDVSNFKGYYKFAMQLEPLVNKIANGKSVDSKALGFDILDNTDVNKKLVNYKTEENVKLNTKHESHVVSRTEFVRSVQVNEARGTTTTETTFEDKTTSDKNNVGDVKFTTTRVFIDRSTTPVTKKLSKQRYSRMTYVNGKTIDKFIGEVFDYEKTTEKSETKRYKVVKVWIVESVKEESRTTETKVDIKTNVSDPVVTTTFVDNTTKIIEKTDTHEITEYTKTRTFTDTTKTTTKVTKTTTPVTTIKFSDGTSTVEEEPGETKVDVSDKITTDTRTKIVDVWRTKIALAVDKEEELDVAEEKEVEEEEVVKEVSRTVKHNVETSESTKVTKSNPAVTTTFIDKTVDVTNADGSITHTTTRTYKDVTSVKTTTTITTTTKTTPITTIKYSNGSTKEETGTTIITTKDDSAFVVNLDEVFRNEVIKVAVTPALQDHKDMGTRTAGYNKNSESYKTAEYDGMKNFAYSHLEPVNAHKAYSRGWTGKGTTVVIADTGIDVDHSEFSGQIKATVDYTGTGVNDQVGHGTHVAGITGAKRDGKGMHGVAFDTKLAVAKVSNSTGYSMSNARKAAQWGQQHGAVAINVSANYNLDNAFKRSIVKDGNGVYHSNHWFYGLNGYNDAKTEAKSWASALGSDMILVNSAGNQGLPYTVAPGQISVVTDNAGNSVVGGKMLIVGNWDVNNQKLASSSNAAGHVCVRYVSGACQDKSKVSDYYIMAPGTAVYSTYHNGSYANMTGTSMAAPVVTGAVAIVSQMWPHMSGENTTKLLLKTANKNIPGYQEYIHGQGLLDLDKATQPVGATGIPTTGRTSGNISSLSSLNGGAATGNLSSDAFAILKHVMVLDEFERDFYVDLTEGTTQKVDTRPGSFVEGLTFGTNDYDAYANLAMTDNNVVTPYMNGWSYTLRANRDLKSGFNYQLNYKTNDLLKDKKLTAQIGFGYTREDGKFLNNVQQGFVGVGQDHDTQYGTLKLNYDIDKKWAIHGTYQLGLTDVEASQDFSLITGYREMVSQSFNVGAKYKATEKLTFGATYSQPLHIIHGKMDYSVPVARTLAGTVVNETGSKDVSTQTREHNYGLYANYNVADKGEIGGFEYDKLSVGAYGELRDNYLNTDGNTAYQTGIRIGIQF